MEKSINVQDFPLITDIHSLETQPHPLSVSARESKKEEKEAD
jgi:hypothetical protein